MGVTDRLRDMVGVVPVRERLSRVLRVYVYAPEQVFSLSEISSEDDVVYMRAARGVRLRTPPERVREAAVCIALEPECESPSSEAESVPRYDRVEVTMLVPEPDVNSIDSSVMRPVPVRESLPVQVRPRVKDEDE